MKVALIIVGAVVGLALCLAVPFIGWTVALGVFFFTDLADGK